MSEAALKTEQSGAKQEALLRLERAIRDVIKREKEDGFIPLHEPCLTGNALEYVSECVTTGWVSSVGKFVDRFESDIARFTGAKRGIAVANGTVALQLAYIAVGVKVGDEVIIPDLTFVATANAVAHCGALPHMADVEYGTHGLDPDKLDDYLGEIGEKKSDGFFNKKTGNRIAAITCMHCFGHPVRIERLREVCDKYGVPLVEDAAESVGSYVGDKHTGIFGDVATFSFNGNKTITTGGGGAIVTNDDDMANFIKHISTTAKRAHPYEFYHDQIGFNYRMPNLNAALGCAQLEELPSFLEKKRKLAMAYKQAFSELENIDFCEEPEGTKSNYWLCTALLTEESIYTLDDVLTHLNGVGLMTRPVWNLMHKLPMYQNMPRMDDLSVSKDLEKRLLSIPSSVNLGE